MHDRWHRDVCKAVDVCVAAMRRDGASVSVQYAHKGEGLHTTVVPEFKILTGYCRARDPQDVVKLRWSKCRAENRHLWNLGDWIASVDTSALTNDQYAEYMKVRRHG